MAYVQPNTLNKVVLVRGAIDGVFNELPYTVAASQTIRKGDIVAKTSGANTIEQAIALPGSNNSVTLSGGNLPILGVAMEDITTDAAGVEAVTGKTSIRVAVFDDNLQVGLRLYNATAADAELRDIALFGTFQFGRFRAASASEWFYVLSTTTTNGEMVYVEPYNGSALDDDYGVAWCRAVISETVRLG